MIKNVVILGSGALATFYAYKWSDNYNVSVIGTWENSIDALNNSGKVKATTNWKEIEEPDLVVWLTKTYRNESALEKYQALNWDCPILILQNGIGQRELFKNILEENQKVFLGITTQGAKLIAPGKVENTGDGDLIVEQNQIFDDFPVKQDAHFEKTLLKKLAINAVLNPVTALFRVKNGEAVQNEPLIKLKELVEVCYPFFEKRNLFTSESEYLDLVIEVAGKTAENINSMLTDIISDRETEVNEILVPIQQEINSPVLQGTIDKLND